MKISRLVRHLVVSSIFVVPVPLLAGDCLTVKPEESIDTIRTAVWHPSEEALVLHTSSRTSSKIASLDLNLRPTQSVQQRSLNPEEVVKLGQDSVGNFIEMVWSVDRQSRTASPAEMRLYDMQFQQVKATYDLRPGTSAPAADGISYDLAAILDWTVLRGELYMIANLSPAGSSGYFLAFASKSLEPGPTAVEPIFTFPDPLTSGYYRRSSLLARLGSAIYFVEVGANPFLMRYQPGVDSEPRAVTMLDNGAQPINPYLGLEEEYRQMAMNGEIQIDGLYSGADYLIVVYRQGDRSWYLQRISLDRDQQFPTGASNLISIPVASERRLLVVPGQSHWGFLDPQSGEGVILTESAVSRLGSSEYLDAYGALRCDR